MSKADHERYRDEFVRRVKRVVVELDEIIEELEAYGAEAPEFWTSYDVRRSGLDLKTASAILAGVEEKLMQVGRWEEIKKSTWATVKASIKKRK